MEELSLNVYCWEGLEYHMLGRVEKPVVTKDLLRIINKHRKYCKENDCEIRFMHGDVNVEVGINNTLYRVSDSGWNVWFEENRKR